MHPVANQQSLSVPEAFPLPIQMALFRSLIPLVTASVLIGRALAITIGPVADLVVHNAVMSPDGFSRGVSIAGDSVSGPLIRGQKVRSHFIIS